MSKNTRTRILLTAVAALLLVVMTVAGTLAYLNDVTDSVTNTFHTSNVDITLQEHPINADGKTLNTAGNPVMSVDTYKMIPGDTLGKDPWVTVINGSEACWVFIKVEETNNTYTGVDGKIINYNIDSTVWTSLDNVAGVYYKKIDGVTTANTDLNVLANKSVTVNEDLTNEQMDAIEKSGNFPKLTFTAYAIQQVGFTTASDAWTEISDNAPAKYETGAAVAEGTKLN